MRYIHGTLDIKQNIPSTITLGKFDGFHRGHRKLMEYACTHKNDGGQAVVFTFSTSPQDYFTGRPGEALATREDKLRLAQQMGIDLLIEYPFTENVRRMEPLDFLEKVLVEQLQVSQIIVGPDCRFGYQGKGTVELLRQMEAKYGYRTIVLDKEMYRGEVISSTRVKACLRQGQIEEANRMLGYDYGITGEVIHGQRIGRTLGVPTINQKAPADQLMPLSGVYRAEILIDGSYYDGMANVGRKPTIAGERPVGVETYIFNFKKEIYGKNVRVSFLEFIRPEIKFSSLEELTDQILKDEVQVRNRIMARPCLSQCRYSSSERCKV